MLLPITIGIAAWAENVLLDHDDAESGDNGAGLNHRGQDHTDQHSDERHVSTSNEVFENGRGRQRLQGSADQVKSEEDESEENAALPSI